MIKFQELSIQFENMKESDVVALVEAEISNNEWKRNPGSEAALRENSATTQYCFDYYQGAQLYAKLWLVESSGILRVSNIVPQVSNQLSKEEYNDILRKFQGRLSGLTEISMSISKENVGINDLLCDESRRAFWAFSHGANRSTGRSHPNDGERWLAFVHSTVKNNEHLDTETMRYLLVEDGWDDDHAYSLGSDFDYGYEAMQYALEVHNES